MRCLSQVPVVHAVEAAVLVIGFSERQFLWFQNLFREDELRGGDDCCIDVGSRDELLQQLDRPVDGLVERHLLAVGVDEEQQATGVERDFGALLVAGGGADAAGAVAVDGQPLDVEHAPAYAVEEFALAAYSQSEVVAVDVVGVEGSDGVSGPYGDEVAQVDEGIDAVDAQALDDAAAQRFGRYPVAVGVFPEGSVGLAGGLYGGVC